MDTLPKYESEQVTTRDDSNEPSPPPYSRRFTTLPTPGRFVDNIGYNSEPSTESSGIDQKQLFLLCKLFTIFIFSGAALALSIVVLVPHDEWYILQLNNTNVHPEVLFRNVILNQNFSTTNTQQYTINDTDLAPYFRVGPINWCEGDIVEGAWVKGKCHGWSQLDVSKFYAQTAGHVGTYNVTSSDSSIVYLPPGYPSSRKIRRYSKNTKGTAIAGAVFNALAVILVLTGTVFMYSSPEITFTCLALMVIACVLGVSMMGALAYGPYYLAGKIIKAFENQTFLFGVEVTRTGHIQLFAGLASGMAGCALLFSLIAIYTT